MYATDNYTFKRIQRQIPCVWFHSRKPDVQQVYNSCYRQHSLSKMHISMNNDWLNDEMFVWMIRFLVVGSLGTLNSWSAIPRNWRVPSGLAGGWERGGKSCNFLNFHLVKNSQRSAFMCYKTQWKYLCTVFEIKFFLFSI